MSKGVMIKNCKDCRHLGKRRFYTADSWEYVETWFCNKTDRPNSGNTDQAEYVENSNRVALVDCVADEPKEIPDWCPLREKAVKKKAKKKSKKKAKAKKGK